MINGSIQEDTTLVNIHAPKIRALEKEMAPHSSVLAWRIPWGSLVGCRLWGHTESDTTEVT